MSDRYDGQDTSMIFYEPPEENPSSSPWIFKYRIILELYVIPWTTSEKVIANLYLITVLNLDAFKLLT